MSSDWSAANGVPPTPLMKTELEKFYFDLYTLRWAQPEVAHMLATVPTIMMWDDHDIIDGWGSYPVERQTCDVFKALWDAARKAFTVFQQHLKFTEPMGNVAPAHGFSFGHVIANTAILALDMRSERTDRMVMSENHWTLVYQWLDRTPKDRSSNFDVEHPSRISGLRHDRAHPRHVPGSARAGRRFAGPLEQPSTQRRAPAADLPAPQAGIRQKDTPDDRIGRRARGRARLDRI